MESSEQIQPKERYDLVVIGAGSGGIATAKRAAAKGKTVAIIENKVIGGTCVNVGCVPKKIMFNVASFLEEAHLMSGAGVKGGENLRIEFSELKHKRDAYIKRLNGLYMDGLKPLKVDYFQGLASFQDEKTILINGDESLPLKGDNILIASGSEPQHASFLEGHELCMDSDGIFQLEELPKSIVVLGGGYIGVEMSQILVAMGVKTTLITRDQILHFVDQEVIGILQECMTKLGLEYHLKTAIQKVEKIEGSDLLRVVCSGNQIFEAEKVLMALGRPPSLKSLNIEKIGLSLTQQGYVKVDEYQNTNIPNIYAIGDVSTPQWQLTPVAIRAGRLLADRIFSDGDPTKSNLKMNYDNIPTVIFSHPPIGSCGLNEKDAISKYGEDKIKVYKAKFNNLLYALAPSDKEKLPTLMKLVCLKEESGNEKVIGFTGLGHSIDEMTQGIGILIVMGASKQDFDNCVAIHPTASEELVLMDAKLIQ